MYLIIRVINHTNLLFAPWNTSTSHVSKKPTLTFILPHSSLGFSSYITSANVFVVNSSSMEAHQSLGSASSTGFGVITWTWWPVSATRGVFAKVELNHCGNDASERYRAVKASYHYQAMNRFIDRPDYWPIQTDTIHTIQIYQQSKGTNQLEQQPTGQPTNWRANQHFKQRFIYRIEWLPTNVMKFQLANWALDQQSRLNLQETTTIKLTDRLSSQASSVHPWIK